MVRVIGVGPAGRVRALYYGAKFISQSAQNLLLAALFISAGTDGTGAIGLSGLMLATLLPGLLLGLSGGAFVDRIGLGRGYALGAALRLLPVAAGILVLQDAASAWMIAFAYSAASQVFTPAEVGLVGVIERDQPGRAHSILVALQYGGQVLGMLVLGPALYFWGGAFVMMAVSAALFGVVAVLATLVMEQLADAPRAAAARCHSFRETCRLFRDQAAPRYALLTLAIKAIVVRGTIVALPLYLSHDLGLGREGFIFLLAPGIVGAIAGLAWGAMERNAESALPGMRRAVAGMIVAVFALAVLDYGLRAVVELSGVNAVTGVDVTLETTFAVALPAAFLLGFSLSLAVIASRVALTASAPVGQQARVFAVQDTLTESLLVLPLLLTGFGAEWAGARPTMAAIAILATLGVFLVEKPRIARREGIEWAKP
ncbi:MAG: MFS transporter [Dehalococcoidia bacterium]|nr:MFS transporter [Dehalococcoidia bacterium]